MYQQMAKFLLEKNKVSPSSVSLPLEGRKERKKIPTKPNMLFQVAHLASDKPERRK